MQTIERMISTSPNKVTGDKKALAECIEACFACEQACVACADACLGESQVDMLKRCIRQNLDCADICAATGRILSRQFESDAHVLRGLLELCMRSCATCGAECRNHSSEHEHCKVCAEACQRCEERCRKMLQKNGGARA